MNDFVRVDIKKQRKIFSLHEKVLKIIGRKYALKSCINLAMRVRTINIIFCHILILAFIYAKCSQNRVQFAHLINDCMPQIVTYMYAREFGLKFAQRPRPFNCEMI